MTPRLARELELVERRFGELEVGPHGDWLVVKRFPLPEGWSKATTEVLVLVPAAYPTTPPDNFWTDADLRVGNGSMPSATSPNQGQVGRSWLQFSYHVETAEWRPTDSPETGHGLVTFLEGVRQRFTEAS